MVTDVEMMGLAEREMGAPSVTIGIPTFNRSRLLRGAIESVLRQTHRTFRLIVSDNASTDDTTEVVATFADARLKYVRADENIGMIGNFNRLIALTETEFLMLLPDDDWLYPEYLSSALDVLQRSHRIGLVHAAVDEVDIDSRVRRHATSSVKSSHPWVVEPGRAILERSMTSTVICQSSATYRTAAIREAGAFMTSEEPFADIPLHMRIAQNWDIGYLHRPLVAFRVHDESETTRLASKGWTEADARDRLLTYGRMMFDRRTGFLDEAGLPHDETNRYQSLASLRFLADQAGLGDPWLQTWAEFANIVHAYPRILVHPIAQRFIVAQFGGRALRRITRRLTSAVIEIKHSWSLRT